MKNIPLSFLVPAVMMYKESCLLTNFQKKVSRLLLDPLQERQIFLEKVPKMMF